MRNNDPRVPSETRALGCLIVMTVALFGCALAVIISSIGG